MFSFMWFVVNGRFAASPELRSEVSRLRDEGVRVEVRVTWEAGDARRWAIDGADAGADVVVGCGGDGTVSEVAHALAAAEHAPALAIVPLGTANAFAAAAGIPLNDIPAAVQLAARGSTTLIDTARVQPDGEDERRCLNTVTVGAAAVISSGTPGALKGTFGGVAYYLQTLLHAGAVTPSRVHVLADDFQFEGAAWGVVVLNGRFVGPRINLAPEALVNDGQLELVVISAETGQSLGHAAAEVAGLTDDTNSDMILRRSVDRVELNGSDLDVTVDGEALCSDRFAISVDPSSIRCILPEACELLSSTSSQRNRSPQPE